MGVALKNPRRIFSQSNEDGAQNARITVLENNEYKITYYAVVSGTSGTLTVPTNGTINAGEFAGLNCILSEIDGSNKPTYVSPKTAGGVIVTATLNVGTGAWTTSGTYTSSSVALIYSIKIKAVYLSNLTYANILESEKNEIVPTTYTKGDILVASATNTLSALNASTSGYVLTSNGAGAVPSWAPASGGSGGYNDVYFTGAFNTIASGGGRNATTGWAGSVWFLPWRVGSDRTVTDIGIDVSTGVAATNVRLALYNDDGTGNPGTLIEDTGDISAATSGFKSFTFLSSHALLTSNKLYWVAVQASSNSIGLRYATIINFVGPSSGAGSAFKTLAQAYGAMPANGSTASWNTGSNTLLVALK